METMKCNVKSECMGECRVCPMIGDPGYEWIDG